MKAVNLVFVVLPIALLLPACGGSDGDELPNLPGQADIDWATDLVESSAGIADVARTALEMLGLLPTYECDQPRGEFVGAIADQFAVDHPCASVTVDSTISADTVTIEFPPGGCEVNGVQLAGRVIFAYAGGQDSMTLEADLSELEIDGVVLATTVGYGTCGDQKNYWVESQGDLPGQSGVTCSLDMTVGKRDGLPIIGGTTLLLNGTASLTSGGGTDQITFEELEYEIGDMLPKEGTLTVETSSGRTIQARFSSSFPIGQVRITIDDFDPVTVPLL